MPSSAAASRNEALLDAMLLAASADGQLSDGELEQVIARVVERPEFEGTRPADLKPMVEASAKRLAGAKTLDAVFTHLRERLPEHRQRVLAFGLACAVALADQAAKREELDLLKTLQAALGISEDEVQRCFETVQRGGSLSEVVGEPIDRLYVDVMVLVSAADGTVHEREFSSMLEQMAGDPAFRDVSLADAERNVRAAVNALATEGAPARLSAIARGLTSPVQRTRAFSLAARIAWADGPPTAEEQRTLRMLQATLGLADDEVQRLLKER
jgi:tellurite resistance protein